MLGGKLAQAIDPELSGMSCVQCATRAGEQLMSDGVGLTTTPLLGTLKVNICLLAQFLWTCQVKSVQQTPGLGERCGSDEVSS